jgi:hypothetical protein
MTEFIQNGFSEEARTLPLGPHHEFQQLCALSVTGELTAEEWDHLRQHLAECKACSQALKEYEEIVAHEIPKLGAELAAETQEGDAGWSIENAERDLFERLDSEERSAFSAHPPARPHSHKARNAARYAIAAAILAACTLGAYQLGTLRRTRLDRSPARLPVPPTTNPSSVVKPSSQEGLPADRSVALRSNPIVQRRDRLQLSQNEAEELNKRLSHLDDELAKRNSDLTRSEQERDELNRELAQARADFEELQSKLALTENQEAQETAQSLALKSQVDNLTTDVEEKDKEIAKEQELLQHDRDIRNLIGARNLYIAEIYDVGKSGNTEKPFGRVFYTKDKSLIFYGYDLDEQHGVKKDSAFQAWGRREGDRQNDINLGLLYKDDANQKRWVLRFNDAKTVADLDAVFITVEPQGGSAKPSGKPLLFTYLRLDPNHP